MQKAQIAFDSYTPPVITEAENLPDYNRRGNAIRTLIADVDKRLYRLSGDTAAEKSRLEAEHAELTRRKLESDAVLPRSRHSRTRKSALPSWTPSSKSSMNPLLSGASPMNALTVCWRIRSRAKNAASLCHRSGRKAVRFRRGQCPCGAVSGAGKEVHRLL